MTEQEIINYYNELVEHYGDRLANWEHEPHRFQWQVTMYRYYREKNLS